MASLFSVTAASNSILVKGNRGDTTFTVTNVSKQPLQCRFDLDAEKPASVAWFQVERPQRSIPPAGAEQVTVKLAAPPETTGSFSFRLIAVSLARPDEDFTNGPSIAFALAQQATPAPAPSKIKWWMILIAIVVVLGVIGGIMAIAMRPAKVPQLTGLSETEAQELAEKKGLSIGGKKFGASKEAAGTVIDQAPQAGEKIPEDKRVSIVVAGSGLVAVPRVTGLSVDDAKAKLEAAGLIVGSVNAIAQPGASGTVARQNPRPDVEVVSGSKIDLTVWQ